MDLRECLASTPQRSLAAIAEAQEIAGYRSLPKIDLIGLLAERLSRSSWRRYAFQQLDVHEMQILRHLVGHNGRIPRNVMEQRFGVIRPYRPWRSDSPRRPWLDPISPAEALHYKGFVYPLTRRTGTARYSEVVLPDEFRSLVENYQAVTVDRPDDVADGKPEFRPLLDIALLLVYLQQNDVAPIHGRWLSPRHFHRLGACLHPPAQTSLAHTELQAGRVPFAHYLAEALGLITLTGNTMKPVPGAIAWLRQSQHAQLEQLWQTWLSLADENRQLWQRYRLPGARLRDPVGFALRLLEVLRDLPAGPWLASDALAGSGIAGLDALLPWWERDKGESAFNLVTALLHGPLTWLGVVETHNRHPEVLAWRITGQGKALMVGEPLVITAAPQPLTLDPHLQLEISDNPPQCHRFIRLS